MNNRCAKCNKKLGIIEYTCKCGNKYCISHLHAEEHECSYDYKKEAQNILKKQIDIGKLDIKIERF
jgi:predicted nucleic acid binding AN1-type Zn finger protein